MEIVNVIEIISGVLNNIESFVIDNTLIGNIGFFTREQAVDKAEALFLAKARENGWNPDTSDFSGEWLLDSGSYDDRNGYEVLISWSEVNTDH